jgi:hypothetical protein
MEVTCTNCNHTTQLDVNFDVKSMRVPIAFMFIKSEMVYVLKITKTFTFSDQLQVGQVGVFYTDYTITGFWSKKMKDLNGRNTSYKAKFFISI